MSSIKRTPTNAQSEVQFSTHEQNQPVACRHGMDTELGLLNHLTFPKWMPFWWWYGRSIVRFRHMVLIPPPRAVRRVLFSIATTRLARFATCGRVSGGGKGAATMLEISSAIHTPTATPREMQSRQRLFKGPWTFALHDHPTQLERGV